MTLINKKLLDETVLKHRHEFANSRKESLKNHFEETLELINCHKFEKEESEKVAFLIKMLELLGYKHHQNLSFEKSTKYRGSIDGNLKEENGETTVAIEWKGIDTPNLDKGKAGETPIDQLFRYMSETKAEFGLLGNFLEFRIYSWQKRKDFFQKFELKELVKNDNLLDELIFLLKPSTILKKEKSKSELENLLDQTEIEQAQITKRFYNDYKQRRANLFEHLVGNNPETCKYLLLEKSQKILDRLVFVMFCEDGLLLPNNIFKKTYNLGKDNRSRSQTKIWEQFQYLFEDIDKGRYDINPNINAFNGGLFAQDLELNSLIIKDEIWTDLIKLSQYNFSSDLDVNILGHIFEQSISDIEEIKADLEGEITDKKKSKRKKDGIFYTPEYITKYIVSETVGSWLEDKNDKLEQIKILDPAGGSGAFPNQVHNFLTKKYVEQIKNKAEKEGFDPSLVEIDEKMIDKFILKNNIFMVDLQPESVEIAKLSLWLKTARKDQKLNNLDENIKCGNSLINDSEIGGTKSFDWQKEFPEVMASGGFDVIVGNPPWVESKKIPQIQKDFFKENYELAKTGTYDLFTLFIERAYNLLNNGGYFGFIIPDRFMTNAEYLNVRKFLLEKTSIIQIVLLGDGVFEEVNMPCLILIFKKEIANKNHNIQVKTNIKGEISNFNQYKFLENKNYIFSVFVDEKEQKIVQQINKNSQPFGNFVDNARGVEIGKSSDLIVENQEFDSVPFLRGEDIDRYSLNQKFYLKLGDNEVQYKTPELYQGCKILIRKTGTGINAVIDEKNNYAIQVIYIFKKREKIEINEKFLLGILNSRILEFWYHANFGEKERKTFPHLTQNKVLELPIPIITNSQQTQIANLVDQIMELKNEIQNYLGNTFTLWNSDFGQNIAINRKLKKFWELSFEEFVTEIEKQKIKLTREQKRNLIENFGVDQKKATKINQEIDQVDDQIELLVREFYGVEILL